MRKGQLVKINEDAFIGPFPGSFIILKGPYEGVFKEGNMIRVVKVVDLLTPTGDVWEKFECVYLKRV